MRVLFSGKLLSVFSAALLAAACVPADLDAGFIDNANMTVGGAADVGLGGDNGNELVGTSWDPAQDSLAEVQAGIADYNSEFGTSLVAPTNFLLKIEGNAPTPTALTITAGYSLSSFAFYSYNTTTNTFSASPLATPLDILSSTVFGFKWIGAAGGDADFAYYTPKANNNQGGFSIWDYTPGVINLAYVDASGDIETSVDPRNNKAISHLSIYGSDNFNNFGVPEPSSLVLLGLGAISALGYRRRQKSKATA